jgi:hypothetical protein
MTNDNFFYCYNEQVKNFLRFEKGIPYLCHGISPTTKKEFWQFFKTDFLQHCLKEYEQRKSHKNTSTDSDTNMTLIV